MRARQQDDILQHRADIGAHIIGVELADIGIIDAHRAAIGGVEPERQPRDGRFARSDAADDGDAFAGRDMEVEAADSAGVLLPG